MATVRLEELSAPPLVPRRTAIPAKQKTTDGSSAAFPPLPVRNHRKAPSPTPSPSSSPEGHLYLTPQDDDLTSQTDIAATVECIYHDAAGSRRSSDDDRTKRYPVKASTQALPPLPGDDSTKVDSRINAKDKSKTAVDTFSDPRHVPPVPTRRNIFTSTDNSPDIRSPASKPLRSISSDNVLPTELKVIRSESNAGETEFLAATTRKSSEAGGGVSADTSAASSKQRPQIPIRPSKSSTSLTEETNTDDNRMSVAYVDVMPLVDRQLEQQPWFFGNSSREDCDERLKAVAENGAFVIRRSRFGGDRCPYTLTLYLNETTINLSIRRRSDDTYALGNEKSDEIVYNDVMELVSFHRINPIKLQNGKSIKLFVSPPK